MDENGMAEGVVYHAGFPNAGETHQRIGLDLQRLVVRHPASTFFWRFAEDIPDTGWCRGDIAVVDRAVQPQHRDIVVAVIDESFVLRRFVASGRRRQLQHVGGSPEENPHVAVWGVVTFVVQQARGK